MHDRNIPAKDSCSVTRTNWCTVYTNIKSIMIEFLSTKSWKMCAISWTCKWITFSSNQAVLALNCREHGYMQDYRTPNNILSKRVPFTAWILFWYLKCAKWSRSSYKKKLGHNECLSQVRSDQQRSVNSTKIDLCQATILFYICGQCCSTLVTIIFYQCGREESDKSTYYRAVFSWGKINPFSK